METEKSQKCAHRRREPASFPGCQVQPQLHKWHVPTLSPLFTFWSPSGELNYFSRNLWRSNGGGPCALSGPSLRLQTCIAGSRLPFPFSFSALVGRSVTQRNRNRRSLERKRHQIDQIGSRDNFNLHVKRPICSTTTKSIRVRNSRGISDSKTRQSVNIWWM